jgi:hypothetical protein
MKLISVILVSLFLAINISATADTLRVISGTTGRLVKTSSPTVTNLTIEGALSEVPDLTITDGVTTPNAVVGDAIIFVDTTDGTLKVIFGDGFIATIAADE